MEFIPRACGHRPVIVKHFATDLKLVAPAPAAPAILAYLTLVNKLSLSWQSASKPLFPTLGVDRRVQKSIEREGDWARLRALADPKILLRPRLSGAYSPGSLEGVWEGIFTVSTCHRYVIAASDGRDQYTEFTSYAALLSGAAPAVLQKSLVAQHRQTIKVREWHFLDPDENTPSENRQPLGPGNPSRGYIPDNIEVLEQSDKLVITLTPSKRQIIYYSTARVAKMGAFDRVQDVFLTGEVRASHLVLGHV